MASFPVYQVHGGPNLLAWSDRNIDRTAEMELKGIEAGLDIVARSDKITQGRQLFNLSFEKLATELEQSKQQFAVDMNKAAMASQIMQYDLERAKVINSTARMKSLSQQLAIQDQQKTLEAQQKLEATQTIYNFDQGVAGAVYDAMVSGDMDKLADVYGQAKERLGNKFHLVKDSQYAPDRIMQLLPEVQLKQFQSKMQLMNVEREIRNIQRGDLIRTLGRGAEKIATAEEKVQKSIRETGGVPADQWGFTESLGDVRNFKKGLSGWITDTLNDSRVDMTADHRALLNSLQRQVSDVSVPKRRGRAASFFHGMTLPGVRRKVGEKFGEVSRFFGDPAEQQAFDALQDLVAIANDIKNPNEDTSNEAKQRLVDYLGTLRNFSRFGQFRRIQEDQLLQLERTRRRLLLDMEPTQQPPTRRFETVRRNITEPTPADSARGGEVVRTPDGKLRMKPR